MTATIIPLRKPDNLRRAFDLIDSLNDTELSPSQETALDEALTCLQKEIEERHG